MSAGEIVLIVGMTIVTFAVRYPVLALVSKANLPAWLLAALKFIPPAVLTAIIVPTLLAPSGYFNFSFSNDYLIAGLITVIVAWRTKNVLLTLAIGMAVMWGWRLLMAWSPIL
jgi:branched-subunit amino acid transport protein